MNQKTLNKLYNIGRIALPLTVIGCFILFFTLYSKSLCSLTTGVFLTIVIISLWSLWSILYFEPNINEKHR